MHTFIPGLHRNHGEACANDDAEEHLNFDEENIIKYYFNRGFNYKEIIQFLKKNTWIQNQLQHSSEETESVWFKQKRIFKQR